MTEHDGVRTESAIAELRRMLDERGVEWDTFSVGSTEYTHWTNSDDRWCAASIGWPLGLHVNILSVTPEQAIAATLGAGTCHVESTTKWDWDRCEPYWVHVLSCGHTVTTMEPEPPHYCSHCGRRVVE